MSEINYNTEQAITAMEIDFTTPEIIVDNKLNFFLGDNLYRAVMPTQKDLSFANSIKNKLYVELLKSGNVLFEKQLIDILKKNQGIDVEELNNKIFNFEKELKEVYITLALKNDNQENKIDDLKKEIERIKKERIDAIVEKTKYLSSSMENQCEEEYYRYLTSSCTEVHETKYNENNEPVDCWKKVWKDFEEFKSDNTLLPFIALSRLTKLILNG